MTSEQPDTDTSEQQQLEQVERDALLTGSPHSWSRKPNVTRWDDRLAEQATRFAMLGLSNERIAELWHVSRDTFYRWMDTQPALADALNRGRDEADANIARSLYERARGYSHPAVKIFLNKAGEPVVVPYVERYPPDSVAALFWLKNRRPDRWRDKQDLDMTVTGVVGRLEDVERTGKALQALQAMIKGKRPFIPSDRLIEAHARRAMKDEPPPSE